MLRYKIQDTRYNKTPNPKFQKNKNIWFLSIGIFLLLVTCILYLTSVYYQESKQEKSITPAVIINNITIPVEIADTIQKQAQGLSDRQELSEDSGMLFVFPESKIRSFWMKNMHFLLDIIWINNNKIINISKNLQPEGEVPDNTYGSEGEVNYVLEVNAGFCDDKGIGVGDVVNFKF